MGYVEKIEVEVFWDIYDMKWGYYIIIDILFWAIISTSTCGYFLSICSYWITGKIGNQNIMITIYKGTHIILITRMSGILSFIDGTTSNPKFKYVSEGLIASKMDSFLYRALVSMYSFVYLKYQINLLIFEVEEIEMNYVSLQWLDLKFTT